MTLLAVVRHGPTEWNAIGRVQGRTDVPLSPGGRDEVRRWVLPPEVDGFSWVSSPLVRTAETARILRGGDVERDARLIEMDWAAWEGATLAALRAELGDLMQAWEARGLDFRAPGGESPRDVQARIAPFLAEVAGRGGATVAVTHKGVIRALYALATGWDMTGKPPHKLHDSALHLFRLAANGTPAPDRLNIPLIDGGNP
ncbi:MAG: histidine phosphatase family protein [Alphaproteobacteria bacterium]|nr:histidine phosphatase family protein [Alphaproteobacteria bacterium]